MASFDVYISYIMAEILENGCVIWCIEFLEADEKTVVARKGLTTLIKFANIRNYSVLSLYLAYADIDNNPLLVHKERFTDPRKRVTNEVVKNEKAILRSSQTLFNWKSQCFLCAEIATVDECHPDRCDVHSVTTLTFRKKLILVCEYRNDELSSVVQIRLNECIDLVAAEAIYHKACYSRFTQNKKRSTTTLSGGRPVNKALSEVFYELCEYSLPGLHEKMVEQSRNGETYSVKTLKTKLKEDCINEERQENRR